jgi:hypothetical protein
MKASNIEIGMRVELTKAAGRRYDLQGDWEVAVMQAKPGYKTPFIYVKSRRPEGGLLAFKPSDLVLSRHHAA